MPFARPTFPALAPALDASRPSINADVGAGEREPGKAGQKVEPVLKPRPDVSAAIARLVAFRDRGIISQQAFLAQERRLLSAAGLRLPAAPARKKKQRWRKALGIAVLLALVGLGIFGLRTLQWGSQRSIAADPVPTLTASAGSRDDGVYPLGKAFQLGEYTYTITGCKTAVTLGEVVGRPRLGPGATYVVVTFSVRNEAKRTRAIPTDDFKLEDANGLIYRACRDATTALLTSGNESDLVWNEIPPGSTSRFVRAFEVQVASLKEPIKLVIPEVGLFARGTAAVYLTF